MVKNIFMIFWQLKKKRASHSNKYGENPFLLISIHMQKLYVKKFFTNQKS